LDIIGNTYVVDLK